MQSELKHNLFENIPTAFSHEILEKLVHNKNLKLERILSQGQATPAGKWYDQAWDEWVILLTGSAGLLFEGEEHVMHMKPGDYVHIRAHRRHRVEWTAADEVTVWLALHFKGE